MARLDVAAGVPIKICAGVAVDSYYERWPPLDKTLMEAELLAEMDEAFDTYAESATKWKVFGYAGLFADFA